jgi:hypothetical protein
MKTCSKCGDSKLIADFPKQVRGIHGVSGVCKACTAARYKRWITENPRPPQDRREYWAAHAEQSRRKVRECNARARDELRDRYVIDVLSQGGYPRHLVTPEMIELKREQISLLRLTKQLKQELTNQLENENGN